MRKNGLAVAFVAELRVCDDVLDDPVRPTSACEIGDDQDRAARNQPIVFIGAEVSATRIGQGFLPYSVEHLLFRSWIIIGVQVRIKIEQRVELVRLNSSDAHAVAYR